MTIKLGNNERESWWVTNNTNETIIVGDLPKIPSIRAGGRIDLLVHISKNDISKSKVLCELIRYNKLSLNKQKNSPILISPNSIPASHADTCVTSAEENEVLGGSLCVTTDSVLVRTNRSDNILEETEITITPECCIGNVGSIQLDIDHTNGPGEGKLQWNSEDGTLEYGLPGGVVNLQVGQETILRVKNSSGTDIANGQAVRITGASGNRPEISECHAVDHRSALSTIGFTTEDILDGQLGYVTAFGLVRDIKTDEDVNGIPLIDGSPLFLSTTPGGFVRFPEVAPNSIVFVGVVVKAHATEGIIFVTINPIANMEEISDVNITNVQENDIIQWAIVDPSVGTARWENTNFPTFANLTLSNLPTSDPTETGKIWNDGGTLKISAG